MSYAKKTRSLKSVVIVLKTYITVIKFDVGEIFHGFERSLFCLPRLHLFGQKYSKNSKLSHNFLM